MVFGNANMGGFPDPQEGLDVFNVNTGLDAKGWQRWPKPPGAKIVMFFLVGGGGGGGGGFSRVAGNAGSGGGGGASSPYYNFMVPAALLPEELYVQVGSGGIGGAPSAAGGAGVISKVAFDPSAALVMKYLQSSDSAPNGGNAGSGAGSSAGGSAASAYSPSILCTVGFSNPQGAQAGSNSGAASGAAGGGVTFIWNTVMTSGGAGGAGCTTTNFNGGGCSNALSTDLKFGNIYVPATVPGGVAGGNLDGSCFLKRLDPFINLGGTGGASNNSGQAGHGGNGGYGSGGGGGGAGTTGGRGGNGGPGVVIIAAF